MDFGIQLATSAHSWKVVKRAEELGYSHAWFFDTQLLNADVFVGMTAAAMQTTRIRLGTGVLIPSNRIAPVTASALAALNALAPGKIDFGVSTGYTGRRTMGLPAITLARLETYVSIVQGLLAGRTVEWAEEGGTHKIRFLNPEIGAINLVDPIPLHVSAFGPKSRRVAARMGAGWMYAMSGVEDANTRLADMQLAWREAGRDGKTLYATAVGEGCVLAEGEPADSARAKAQAGPAAAMMFHKYVEEDEYGSVSSPAPPQFKKEFKSYRKLYQSYQPENARYLSLHRGHLMFLRPEEERFMSGNVIRALTFTGTQSELVEGVRVLKDAGYSQFAVDIRHGQENAMLQDWADVFAKV